MPRRFRLVACVAGVLLAITACSKPQRPNVVFILVDTLRKDALRVYGNPLPISPAIDAVAARGAVFENHFTHASQTIPATLSLLLSRLPSDHGFSDPDRFVSVRPVYPPEWLFLQEVFHQAGYATAGFTANPFLTHTNGFDQGFDTFTSFQGSGDELNRGALAWLGARTRAQPFFLYLHYMDVHQPYEPPETYVARFVTGERRLVLGGNRAVPLADARDLAYTRAVYQACVAHADDLIGAVLRKIDELGVRDETLVVITADHGEEFGEHGGVGHGRSVYGELVRVPLVMALPGRIEAGRRVAHLSKHLDLAPTIVQLAGLAVPSEFQGTSVLEPAAQVFLEIGPWRGIVAGDSKWVWNRTTDEQQLFALSDELDHTPLTDPAVASRLRAQLDSHLALEASRAPSEAPPTANASWSPEEAARLRALGYAQ